jgi:cellulose 1,4-beta-cellobiosidase
VNPDWSAQARANGGSAIANYNTAVWLDRIAAVTVGSGNCTFRGLRSHLDEAVAQGANLIMIVIYNLPNRDCAAYASSGELLVAQDGIRRYREEYIDPIVSIMSDPKYANLRIVIILEPDSLPNLVTNLSTPLCAEAQSSGAYVESIRYAINRLNTLPNTYIYLDIAHSGWLGWDSNFGPAADLFASTIKGTTKGVNSVDGFVSNTANYTPVEEPFLTDPNLTVGGQPVRSAAFYEWNPYFDELDFVTAMRNALIQRGFPSTIGMLIDTSRNGWGGSSYGRSRPTAVSTSTDLNTYVNQSRIDRRYHRGNWCNQQGGIGERPRANPASGVDAFVWVKPPGESDGISVSGVTDPCDPNKRHDIMCDPNAQSRYNSSYSTGAMAGAPHAGQWFQAQFEVLLRNAYPPLQ